MNVMKQKDQKDRRTIPTNHTQCKCLQLTQLTPMLLSSEGLQSHRHPLENMHQLDQKDQKAQKHQKELPGGIALGVDNVNQTLESSGTNSGKLSSWIRSWTSIVLQLAICCAEEIEIFKDIILYTSGWVDNHPQGQCLQLRQLLSSKGLQSHRHPKKYSPELVEQDDEGQEKKEKEESEDDDGDEIWR